MRHLAGLRRRLAAAEDALAAAQAARKQAETAFDAASDQFTAAEQALDAAREQRARARQERYAARQAHEQADLTVRRLRRRVDDVAGRGDLAPPCSPTGCCWPSTPAAPTPASARSPRRSGARGRPVASGSAHFGAFDQDIFIWRH